jgi:arsenate reductase (thioredoxin)
MSEQETKKRVLFLCTGNSCRSQMAEGALRKLAGDRFEAASAGTSPTQINPMAVRVMAEIGIDISEQRSKSVVEMMGEQFDYVVTVCDRAREACPVIPGGATKLHWSFDDPASAEGSEEKRLEVFRRVRDEIVSSVREFVVDHVGSMDKPSDAVGGNPVGMTCL